MRFARALPTWVLLVTLTGLLIVQLLRDRAHVLQMLMYVPIWPVAVLALIWDALRRGRALRFRWALSLIAIASGLIALSLMWRPALPAEGAGPELRVVHWNTQWGHGHGARSIDELAASIAPQAPDVLFMSEAPYEPEFERVWGKQHPNWASASVEQEPFSRYWYRMTVMSRFPVELMEEWPLSHGHAALFELGTSPRPLRVVMVDLESAPRIPRSPSLRELAQKVDERSRAGEPIDLLVGDFNTPGRFLGFDDLSAAGPGYRRAAMWSGQWRGTWPSRVALSPFDIDHIWVRNGIDVAGARIFRSRASDHRGQLARLRVH